MTKFDYTEETWRSLAPGRRTATWAFDDGVTVDMRIPPYCTYFGRGAAEQTPRREFTRKARVYVSSDQPFSVIEDLQNRFRRPFDMWKPGTTEALQRAGVDFDKLRWDQRAGCSCGCSPGFVIEGGPVGVEFWVTLPGAALVDEAKDARELVLS